MKKLGGSKKPKEVQYFRVIICGSRDFTQYRLLERYCDRILSNKDHVIVVSGKEPNGADNLGEVYAESRYYEVDPYPADWDTHGKAAGPIRNSEMVKNADAVIAFWDGKSPGTKDLITKARKAGLPTRVLKW